MFLPLLRFAVLPLFALPVLLRAQAAVEYALKSAGGAAAAAGGSTIAGCRMDANLLSCLSHAYPRTAIVIAVVVVLLMIRWLAGRAAYRAR